MRLQTPLNVFFSLLRWEHIRATWTEDGVRNTLYLDGLAVVHFDDVEVKTVYSFAWRNEVASLLIEIPPDVHQNLEESRRDRRRRGRVGGGGAPLTALLSLSVVFHLKVSSLM